jgi:hypothetical protein
VLCLGAASCGSTKTVTDAAVDAPRDVAADVAADLAPADVDPADTRPPDANRFDAPQGDRAPDAIGVDRQPPPPDAALEALPRPDVVVPDVGHLEAGPAVTMSFFVTSKGTGAAGGNLGGLAGADKICQDLATAAGAGHRTWHAYLSTQGPGAVNARDRIGTGPWYNYLGVMIAASVPDLHGTAPYLNAETALDEKGARVPGKGSPPPAGNQQDILTGSRADGTAFPENSFDDPPFDRTCRNWTTATVNVDAAVYGSSAEVGHFDRIGLGEPGPSPGMLGKVNDQSWSSAHATPGCSEGDLKSVGGAGRLYCFAID